MNSLVHLLLCMFYIYSMNVSVRANDQVMQTEFRSGA